MGAQADAEFFLRLGGVGRSVFGGDGEGLHCLGCAGFGGGSRLGDGGFEDLAVVAGECLFHVVFSFGQRRVRARSHARRRLAGRRCSSAAFH